MIIGIVAIAQNFAIGRKGKLPWHYSTDLKFFKQTTTGNTVVMGRKTFESIGKPLPNRLNIVLSRKSQIETRPKLMALKNIEEIIALSEYLKGDIYIIGGAEIYRSLSDAVEKWIVTEIPETIEDADAFMPKSFLSNFKLRETKELEDNLRVKIYEKLS
jgi:dihydrofolate reductase